VVPGWKYQPVVHVSQVGYYPSQPKKALIEMDKSDDDQREAVLYRLTENGYQEIKRQVRQIKVHS